jgi:hypothetical protein
LPQFSNGRFIRGNGNGEITALAGRIFAIMATAVQDRGPSQAHRGDPRDQSIADRAAARSLNSAAQISTFAKIAAARGGQ